MSRLSPMLLAITMAMGSLSANASDSEDVGDPEQGPRTPKITLQAEARVDFDWQHFTHEDNVAGFHGRYLNVKLDANINSQLSVHWRQRLNKFGEMKSDVFGATDWVYLNYSPTSKWTFSAGKQVVAIGGYEYDRAPINIYYASMFWDNIACYQFGVSSTYHLADGRHNILAQVCNSPYQTIGNSCFAYNLMWMGTMGRFSTIWSANLIEYQRGHYANLISLGNRLDFKNFYAELDLMNRYFGHQRFLADDYTVIGKACATFGRFDIFAKGGYEHYRPEPGNRYVVKKPFYGLGLEYYPLKGSRDLRVHLVGDITHDSFTGTRCSEVGAGVTWRVNILKK